MAKVGFYNRFFNVRLCIYKGKLKEWILKIYVDYIVYVLENIIVLISFISFISFISLISLKLDENRSFSSLSAYNCMR